MHSNNKKCRSFLASLFVTDDLRGLSAAPLGTLGEIVVMPTISMFYGILIRMFFYDTDKHNVPHIHAEYQGQVAVYSILDGAVLAGGLPTKKHKLVVAWIEIHQDDLLADWQLAVNGKKLFPIRGLDQ